MRLKSIRLILIVMFIAVVGIIALIVFALGQEEDEPDNIETPASEGLFALETSDCALPCLLGITPGETATQQALEIASNYASATPGAVSGNFDIECEAGQCIHVELWASDPRQGDYVRGIVLIADRPGKLTTVSEMLDRGYVPQRVFRRDASGPDSVGLVVLFTGDTNIIADVVGIGAVAPNSQIPYLIIVAEQDLDRTLEEIRVKGHLDDDNEISWLGFASVQDYYDAPPLVE